MVGKAERDESFTNSVRDGMSQVSVGPKGSFWNVAIAGETTLQTNVDSR